MTDALLTKSFCEKNRLHFLPLSKGEARYIQRRLLDYGFYWSGGNRNVKNVQECVDNGITLAGGIIYHGLNRNESWIDADISQFPGFDPRSLMTQSEKAFFEELRALRAAFENITAPPSTKFLETGKSAAGKGPRA